MDSFLYPFSCYKMYISGGSSFRPSNSLESILEEEIRFGKYIPTAENVPIRSVYTGQK